MQRMTLPQRVFLVTAIASLPAVAILVLNFHYLRSDAEKTLQNEATRTARYATLEMNRIIGGVDSVLRTIAAAPSVETGDRQACTEFLARLVNTLPQLAVISIADADGIIQCTSFAPADLTDISDRDYFQRAVKSSTRITGTYTLGRTTKVASLPIALPLATATGWRGGVIVGALDLGWLGQRLKERDFAKNNALTIADRNGVILAREPFPEKFVGTPIPDAYISLVTAPTPGTTAVTSQDGTHRMIGYAPVSDATDDLYISAGIASDPIYAALGTLLIRGAMLALAGIGAALILAQFTSRYFITSPFNNLIKTLEAWQKDSLTSRTNMGEELAEFGRAGKALDAFMEQLLAARSERRLAESHRRLLTEELDHRVKNLFSTVQAISRQTFRGKGQDAAEKTFSDRLMAMASAHKLLMDDAWQAAPLGDLVLATIAPFDRNDTSRFLVSGPQIVVNSKATMSIGMALHELCTNAVKYGALSTATGKIIISWAVSTEASAHLLTLDWQETGGPAPSAPRKNGFGSLMINTVLAQQIDGQVTVDYAETGFTFRLIVDLQNVSPGGPQQEGG